MLLCSGVGAVISCKGVRWTARNLMSFESDTYPHQLFSWKNFTKYFWSDYIIVFLVFSLLLSCGLIKNKREKNWSGGKDWDKTETGMLVRTNAAVGKEVICWVHVDKWHLWVMKYLQKMSKKKKILNQTSSSSGDLWAKHPKPCDLQKWVHASLHDTDLMMSFQIIQCTLLIYSCADWGIFILNFKFAFISSHPCPCLICVLSSPMETYSLLKMRSSERLTGLTPWRGWNKNKVSGRISLSNCSQ